MSCNCSESNTPSTNSAIPVCPGGEACEESFPLHCVDYQGDEIVELNIAEGVRLDEIVQLIAIKLAGYPCTDGSPVLGIKSIAVSYNSIEIEWKKQDGITYVVSFKKEEDAAFVDTTVGTVGKHEITGLLAGTTYHVRVKKLIGGLQTCSSVTLSITTKAA